jgi:hypothetical protein
MTSFPSFVGGVNADTHTVLRKYCSDHGLPLPFAHTFTPEAMSDLQKVLHHLLHDRDSIIEAIREYGNTPIRSQLAEKYVTLSNAVKNWIDRCDQHTIYSV